jgi:hypothetical protein
MIKLDSSSLTRFEHVKACIKIAIINFPFGIGSGQVGFFIADNLSLSFLEKINNGSYPSFWVNFRSSGGTPTFSWPFKLLAEIGFIGIVFFVYYFWISIASLKLIFRDDIFLRFFVYSFCGFLFSSIAIEGNFYLTGYLILGVILSHIQKLNSNNT